MPTLSITEINDIGYAQAGAPVMAPDMPPVFEQALPISGAVETSAEFQPGTRYVMIKTDANCYLGWDADPVALMHPMQAGERLFYGVKAGHTVSVVSA